MQHNLKQQALVALHAIATGGDDTREFYQDIETIREALELLPSHDPYADHWLDIHQSATESTCSWDHALMEINKRLSYLESICLPR